MDDSSLSRSSFQRDLYQITAYALIGVFGVSVGLSRGYDPLIVLLGLAAFYPSLVVGICLHEYGHVLGGWSVGAQVSHVELGRRYPQWKPWIVRFLGLRWLINSAPFSGAAYVTFLDATNYRIRQCWMVACGPLVNLIFLIGGIVAIRAGYTEALSPFLAGWCAANVYLLTVSLNPSTHRRSKPVRPTDGLLFVQTLRYSDDDIAQAVLFNKINRELSAEGDLEELNIPELLEKHQAVPSNFAVLWKLSFKLVEDHDPRCLPYLLQLLQDARLPRKSLCSLIDIYLTNQLHVGPPEDAEAADKLSLRLLELSDSISTRGTRGSVLVDIKRTQEGRAMLQEVLEKTNSAIDKSYSLIFLGLAHESAGEIDDARAHAVLAREIDPTCSALKRVAHLLEPNRTRKS